jgi:tripartite-type tricarboxylate transporter receptor subunit TctC
MQKARLLLSAAVVGALSLIATIAQAQDYPTRAITIVVPASPGGAIDTVARLVGQKLSETWGQAVVVDNKPGASNTLGTAFVAKSAPDGYTLVIVASNHAAHSTVFKKLTFDPLKDFEPVAFTHIVPLMLVVNPSVPANTVKELITYAKAHPGELNYASSGKGSSLQMAAEMFKSATGTDIMEVAYKGSTAAHPDLLGGRVSMIFDTITAINPHVQSGALKALAVTTRTRAPLNPNVPTMEEAGLAGYDTSTWGGILAPKGTPKEVITKLNVGINNALADPEVGKKFADVGISVPGGPPQMFGEYIKAETARWAKVAKEARITADE